MLDRDEIIEPGFVDDVDGDAYFDQVRQKAIDLLRGCSGFFLVAVPADGSVMSEQLVCAHGDIEDVAVLYFTAQQAIAHDIRKLAEGGSL